MGRATGDFANVKMLAKRLNQRGRNWTLILVDDRKNDTFALAVGLGGRSDDHYHDDRDDHQRNEPKVVAAYEPEVLKHNRQRLQTYASPPGFPYCALHQRTNHSRASPPVKWRNRFSRLIGAILRRTDLSRLMILCNGPRRSAARLTNRRTSPSRRSTWQIPPSARIEARSTRGERPFSSMTSENSRSRRSASWVPTATTFPWLRKHNRSQSPSASSM